MGGTRSVLSRRRGTLRGRARALPRPCQLSRAPLARPGTLFSGVSRADLGCEVDRETGRHWPYWSETSAPLLAEDSLAGSFRPRRERCARCSREGRGSGGGGTDPRAHGATECAHAGLARAALGGDAVGPFLGRKGCGSTTLATGWAFPPRIRARGSWVVLRWYCHGRSVARDGVWLGWAQHTDGLSAPGA